MAQTGETLRYSPENYEGRFDELVNGLLLFSERNIISKLSAKTAREEIGYDTITYRYETPALHIIIDEHNGSLSIEVYREDHLNPADGTDSEPSAYNEIQINFAGQSRGEGETIERQREIYNKNSLGGKDITRLEQMVGLYVTAVRNLSAEEAKAKGLSDEAISYLGLS